MAKKKSKHKDAKAGTVDLPTERDQLAADLKKHITNTLGSLDAKQAFDQDPDADPKNDGQDYRRPNKPAIRNLFTTQRDTQLTGHRRVLTPNVVRGLMERLATGSEVAVDRIDPYLVQVKSGTKDALLFRLATTMWSVPVSAGYGRRLRYLVIDRQNDKLIGLFALGDPVIAMRDRDKWIGWDKEQRFARLKSVMDAYVVGAVQPYSQLLGGKLVSSLIGSSTVTDDFMERYGNRETEYSKLTNKTSGVFDGHLALIMITSAMGRSSIYNRVRLPDLVNLQRVGVTQGYGHFHVPNDVFSKMRNLLELDGHVYSSGHQYGNGANWRMRVVRQCLAALGLDQDLLRHRIYREVFGMPLTSNWREFLNGEAESPAEARPTAEEIGEVAKTRWLIPRSKRSEGKGWARWSRVDIENQLMTLLEPVEGDQLNLIN